MQPDLLDATPCTYCGVLADTVDHTVPRWLLERAEDAGVNMREMFSMERWTVPACHECNSALGNRLFRTLAERRKFVHDGIRKRWAKFLRLPEWSEEELAEMAPKMRDEIRRSLRTKQWVEQRLAWTGVGRDVQLASVYAVYQRVCKGAA